MAQSVNCVEIEIAERAGGVRVNVIHFNVGVVHPADIAHDDLFLANLLGELIHRLVAALADGFIHLHLQDEVAAALQIQA